MPAPIPEWRAPTDPRHEIEVEHLMRMTTGLALDETNSGFDPLVHFYNAPVVALQTGAVPEPGSWALMIVGLGTVGGLMRGKTARRRAFA